MSNRNTHTDRVPRTKSHRVPKAGIPASLQPCTISVFPMKFDVMNTTVKERLVVSVSCMSCADGHDDDNILISMK